MNYCKGCGVELTNVKGVGYTPLSIEKAKVCERCHKLKHYNVLDDIGLDNKYFKEQLSGILEKDALFVYILDILDIEGSNVEEIRDMLQDNNKDFVVLFNRRDLLPLQRNEEELYEFCEHMLDKCGIKPMSHLIISALKNKYIDEAIDMLDDLSNDRDIVFLGTANIGKSSTIRSIMNALLSNSADVLISNFPGTTINCIQHQLNNGAFLWDTPGIINNKVITTYTKQEDIIYFKNQKEIKPITFQTNPGQTYYIGKVAKLRFIDGPKTGFTFVIPELINIHRTKTEEEWRIDQDNEQLNLLPIYKGKTQVHKFKLKTDKERVALYISGLGFITLGANGQEVEIETIEGVLVYVDQSVL